MAVVTASDLAKDVAGAPLLRGVSFKLERRDRMTLSGRNGSGKTTLLRMLAGQASVDGGALSFQKGAKVALHDQRPPRERDVTLRDYVLSGAAEVVEIEQELARLEEAMAGGADDAATLEAYSATQARFDLRGGYRWRDNALVTMRGLGFAEDDLDRRLSTFSGGELTRGALARVLTGEPDLLLLDEPTNHLDIASLEWLEGHLTGLDAAIVLVAHDRWFLEAVGTSVLELEGARARLAEAPGSAGGAPRSSFFKGPWHAWRTEQAAREIALGRAIERQQAEIARLERFVERFRAKASKARQAQSRVKRLGRMERIERDPADGRSLEFSFAAPERTGRTVIEMENGSIQVPGRTLIDDVSMWLERGEHVTLVGGNGSGKTTLIEALTGRAELPSGKLRTGHNVSVGYVSQHAEEFSGAGTVLDAAQRATGLTPGKARALLGRFLFSGADAMKPVDSLSGGELRRLALAVLVQSDANVLVLDEPTNHLDLDGREALEDALRAFPGSLLLVSHDRALLDAVGSRTLAIEDGTLHSYEGGYAEYAAAREARRAAQEAAAAPAAPQERKPKPTRPKGPSKNAQRAQRELEREIEAAEAALHALEDELADPAAWSDAESSAEASERHAKAKREVEELLARWEGVAP